MRWRRKKPEPEPIVAPGWVYIEQQWLNCAGRRLDAWSYVEACRLTYWVAYWQAQKSSANKPVRSLARSETRLAEYKLDWFLTTGGSLS